MPIIEPAEQIGTIELEDGRIKNINDVEINEQLKFGERVLGMVEIDATNMNGGGIYKFGEKSFIGGPNLRIRDGILGNKTSLDFYGEQISDVKKLYQNFSVRKKDSKVETYFFF